MVNYLTFSSSSSFTLATYNTTKNWDGTLEYSTDTSTWNTWDGTTTLSADNGKLYLRGTGNTKIVDSSTDCRWVLSGSDISCNGNIENLLDYATVANREHPTMAKWCYCFMFYYCKSLTVAPELPATTLASNCYYGMFKDCTALTTAPELPATTLADNCYNQMFNSCTALTTAPELPATTLADYCYTQMFRNCTALTTAPELPATTLADYCYTQMFQDCTALTTLPELPATTLASNCYDKMFYGCAALTTAPELPATTLASSCYYGMFKSCTSLTTLLELPATTLASSCYSQMFNGCTNIKLSETQTGEYQAAYRIPTSGSGTTATYALSKMFTNTGGTFTGEPTINTTYYTSNRVIPEPTFTFDLTTLGLDEGTHSIYVKLNGDGWSESDASNTVQYTVEPQGVTLAKGTYVAKDKLPTQSLLTQSIQFTSNGNQYDSIKVGEGYPDSLLYHKVGDEYYHEVYNGMDGWGNTAYKTITLKTDQTVSTEFGTWFNANFTLKYPLPALGVSEGGVYKYYDLTPYEDSYWSSLVNITLTSIDGSSTATFVRGTESRIVINGIYIKDANDSYVYTDETVSSQLYYVIMNTGSND